MKDSDKGFIAWLIIATIAFSVLAMAWSVSIVAAPSGRRGVMSVVMNGVKYVTWPQTESGFIKTVDGRKVQNTDIVFASAKVGEQIKSYVNLLDNPNTVAENVEISADKSGMTISWWETNVALHSWDKDYTTPVQTISTDNGTTWSVPQDISDLPEGKLIAVGSK